MTSLSDFTLSGFIAAVAADQPSPGCGGAAAVGLALAAACACKAFRVSARRQGGAAALEGAAERCAILWEAALAGAQRDAINFEAMLKAGPQDCEPKQTLEGDGQVLLAMASELRDLVERHGEAIDQPLFADAEASLALIEAFERIQARNLAAL